ncbi:uncharacterized protein METZ01_LOCUS129657 [marine metagenome]|jgi:hypothetical protein|uniref:Uncharacterized protein n=1 Tax=marine metagenome TaxID=408172 RepID=A0A381YJW9_9ZZZZ
MEYSIKWNTLSKVYNPMSGKDSPGILDTARMETEQTPNSLR